MILGAYRAVISGQQLLELAFLPDAKDPVYQWALARVSPAAVMDSWINPENKTYILQIFYDSEKWTGIDGNRKPAHLVLWSKIKSRIFWPAWRVRRAMEREFS